MTCLSSKSGCDGKNNVGSHFITGETRTTNQSAKERDCPPLGAATSSPPPSTTTTTRPHSPTHWVKPRRANPLRAKSLFISTPSCPAPSSWPSCCGALRRPPLLLRPPPPPKNKAQRTKGQGWDCHGCCRPPTINVLQLLVCRYNVPVYNECILDGAKTTRVAPPQKWLVLAVCSKPVPRQV